MNIVTGWPRARPITAKEIPVLPLVASTIVSPGLDGSRSVRVLEYAESHPALDTAGEVDLLRFGVDGPRLVVVAKVDPEERGVADYAPEPLENLGSGRCL
jgi:hypothetical protein